MQQTVPTTWDFTPPTAPSLPPELTGPPPRRLASDLERGPHARRKRTVAVIAATFGVLCLGLARLPGIDDLARYVLPFGYLTWIGLGAILLSGAGWLERQMVRGPYRYVRDGVPTTVRICELIKAPATLVNGSPATYAFRAAVLARHPESGALSTLALRSVEFSAGEKAYREVPFRVGDYAPALYLPGQFETSLQIYAFLDVSPTTNLRRSDEAPATPTWQTALVALGGACFLFALVASIYAVGRYQPVDFDFMRAAVPMAGGALVVGSGLTAWLWGQHRREQARLASASLAALAEGRAVELGTPFMGGGFVGRLMTVLIPVGGMLLGAVIAVASCFFANAWLDRSLPRPVAAEVVQMTEITHAFLFREYELELRLADARQTHKLLTTPQVLAQLTDAEVVALVREGRFGWRWIADVAPAARGIAGR
jgi:hypothetical protein